MRFEADAVAVAAGTLDVIRAADVLRIAEQRIGQPVPVAVAEAGDYCVVLFLAKLTERNWRTEVVRVRNGEMLGSGGGIGGGIRTRSEAVPGSPFVEGEGRLTLDDETELVSVDGVSADDVMQLLSGGRAVATAQVADHGYFVLAAILPPEAVIAVEAVPAQTISTRCSASSD